MRDDLKGAVRSLRSNRGFTIAALIVLTLGIGATTAIFSVVDAVVLRGLPFDEQHRLVAVGQRPAVTPTSGALSRDPARLMFVAPQNYRDWAAQQQVFESMAAVASGWLTLRLPGVEPESLVPQRVTADFFKVLRVSPALGRTFTVDNESAGADRVALLSDALWRRRFGADPQIVGRVIPLELLEGGRRCRRGRVRSDRCHAAGLQPIRSARPARPTSGFRMSSPKQIACAIRLGWPPTSRSSRA